MPPKRSRWDDEDSDDDRPRSRRRDDDDDDDHPRSRRREDDDDEDRPARTRSRSRGDYDDLPPRPRRRARRRSSRSGANVGKIVFIVSGGIAVVAVFAIIIVLIVRGGFSGRSNISFESYESISQTDTMESLRTKFGRPKEYDRAEWGQTTPGAKQGSSGSTLLQYCDKAKEVTAWYSWYNGPQEVYVAEGTDYNGRKGLVLKIYVNPKVVQDAILNPGAPKENVPWFQFDQIGVGGKVRFG